METQALFETHNLVFSYPSPQTRCGFFSRKVAEKSDEAKKITFPDLKIFEGEHVAFLGSNGCGKTTLLKLLNGLLTPSSGEILYHGEQSGKSPLLRAQSLYVHQFPYLLAGSVLYNVQYAVKLPKDEKTAAAQKALELFGLAGFEKRQAQKLSGGEAQRTALARALATGAKILLLDEPTASADSASAELILKRLLQLDGYTLLFSTHNAQFAQKLAGRLIQL